MPKGIFEDAPPIVQEVLIFQKMTSKNESKGGGGGVVVININMVGKTD